LRSHGITVYGGFEDGGVKVIELGRGKEYTIHRTTPIASLRVLFSVDKNTLQDVQDGRRPPSVVADSDICSIKSMITSSAVVHPGRLWTP